MDFLIKAFVIAAIFALYGGMCASIGFGLAYLLRYLQETSKCTPDKPKE